jgi:non-heme chloroperoxidase
MNESPSPGMATRHGTERVSKAVLTAAVPPIMLETARQIFREIAIPFYGTNRDGAIVSQSTLDQFWPWSMQDGLKNADDCIKSFSEIDFAEDIGKIDVPTLVLHGEDGQIVPVNNFGRKSARLIAGAKSIYYSGAPHGMTATHQDQINADLLAFLRN